MNKTLSKRLPLDHVSRREAAVHFPSLSPERDSTTWMFNEDVRLGIVPVRFARDKDGAFEVTISGDEAEVDRAVQLLQSMANHERRDLKELLADTIRTVATGLTWWGRVPYEIMHDGEERRFAAVRFTAQRLFNLGWWWIQAIPKEDRYLWKKSFTMLPKRKVWVATIPKELGGGRGYRRLSRRLRRFSKSAPNFWQKDLEQGEGPPTYFDFKDYRRKVDAYEARSTRLWGWTRRDLSGENWTEFTLMFRTLTFRWAQATLRDDIVRQLNALLVRLGIRAEIKLSGVPTAEQILQLRDKMSKGEISFDKAYSEASG